MRKRRGGGRRPFPSLSLSFLPPPPLSETPPPPPREGKEGEGEEETRSADDDDDDAPDPFLSPPSFPLMVRVPFLLQQKWPFFPFPPAAEEKKEHGWLAVKVVYQ